MTARLRILLVLRLVTHSLFDPGIRELKITRCAVARSRHITEVISPGHRGVVQSEIWTYSPPYDNASCNYLSAPIDNTRQNQAASGSLKNCRAVPGRDGMGNLQPPAERGKRTSLFPHGDTAKPWSQCLSRRQGAILDSSVSRRRRSPATVPRSMRGFHRSKNLDIGWPAANHSSDD